MCRSNQEKKPQSMSPDTIFASRNESRYGLQDDDILNSSSVSINSTDTTNSSSSTSSSSSSEEIFCDLGTMITGPRFNSSLAELKNISKQLSDGELKLLVRKLVLLKDIFQKRDEKQIQSQNGVVDLDKTDAYYSKLLSGHIRKIELSHARKLLSPTPNPAHQIKKMPKEAVFKKEWFGGYVHKHDHLSYYTTDFLKDRIIDFTRLAEIHKVVLCETNVYAFECKGDIPEKLVEDLRVHHINKSERPLYSP